MLETIIKLWMTEWNILKNTFCCKTVGNVPKIGYIDSGVSKAFLMMVYQFGRRNYVPKLTKNIKGKISLIQP